MLNKNELSKNEVENEHIIIAIYNLVLNIANHYFTTKNQKEKLATYNTTELKQMWNDLLINNCNCYRYTILFHHVNDTVCQQIIYRQLCTYFKNCDNIVIPQCIYTNDIKLPNIFSRLIKKVSFIKNDLNNEHFAFFIYLMTLHFDSLKNFFDQEGFYYKNTIGNTTMYNDVVESIITFLENIGLISILTTSIIDNIINYSWQQLTTRSDTSEESLSSLNIVDFDEMKINELKRQLKIYTGINHFLTIILRYNRTIAHDDYQKQYLIIQKLYPFLYQYYSKNATIQHYEMLNICFETFNNWWNEKYEIANNVNFKIYTIIFKEINKENNNFFYSFNMQYIMNVIIGILFSDISFEKWDYIDFFSKYLQINKKKLKSEIKWVLYRHTWYVQFFLDILESDDNQNSFYNNATILHELETINTHTINDNHEIKEEYNNFFDNQLSNQLYNFLQRNYAQKFKFAKFNQFLANIKWSEPLLKIFVLRDYLNNLSVEKLDMLFEKTLSILDVSFNKNEFLLQNELYFETTISPTIKKNYQKYLQPILTKYQLDDPLLLIFDDEASLGLEKKLLSTYEELGDKIYKFCVLTLFLSGCIDFNIFENIDIYSSSFQNKLIENWHLDKIVHRRKSSLQIKPNWNYCDYFEMILGCLFVYEDYSFKKIFLLINQLFAHYKKDFYQNHNINNYEEDNTHENWEETFFTSNTTYLFKNLSPQFLLEKNKNISKIKNCLKQWKNILCEIIGFVNDHFSEKCYIYQQLSLIDNKIKSQSFYILNFHLLNHDESLAYEFFDLDCLKAFTIYKMMMKNELSCTWLEWTKFLDNLTVLSDIKYELMNTFLILKKNN